MYAKRALEYNPKTQFATGHQSFANYISIISYVEVLSSIHDTLYTKNQLK